MLAQNFKTAAELGIEDAEWAALVKVLGMFERKEIPEHLFDMLHFGEPQCGLAGCILAWAGSVSPGVRLCAPFLGGMYPHGLFQLFFEVHQEAKTAHAAVALRNYLTIGQPNWDEVME